MVAHNCHGKTKKLTAKTKTSWQNQILHSESKIALVLPWVFAFAVRYLVFAVKYLVLPWGLWFCHQVFGFVMRYFVFAVRFLVLLWGFCYWCEVFGFAMIMRYFVFAVRFLVLAWGILFLPWGFRFCREVFCFCREVFGFAVIVVGHRKFLPLKRVKCPPFFCHNQNNSTSSPGLLG